MNGINRKGVILVMLCGGSGGALNAYLCYAQIPLPIPDIGQFDWQVIPGGALHGAALALISYIAFYVLQNRSYAGRYLFLPIVGWVAGFVSWIPLHHWAAGSRWSDSLLWTFKENWDSGVSAILWKPFEFFGLVSVILLVCFWIRGERKSLKMDIACGVCAGVFGSLWFWIASEPWYFSPIHGVTWGFLVGVGVHNAMRNAQ